MLQVTYAIKPICIASAHAVDDFILLSRRHELALPYALASTVPTTTVIPLFFVASVYHFANDVGVWSSVCMHLFWALLWYTDNVDFAFAAFALYYCGVHAPIHVFRSFEAKRGSVVILITAACVAAMTVMLPEMFETMEVGTLMQRIMLGHVGVDLMVRNMDAKSG